MRNRDPSWSLGESCFVFSWAKSDCFLVLIRCSVKEQQIKACNPCQWLVGGIGDTSCEEIYLIRSFLFFCLYFPLCHSYLLLQIAQKYLKNKNEIHVLCMCYAQSSTQWRSVCELKGCVMIQRKDIVHSEVLGLEFDSSPLLTEWLSLPKGKNSLEQMHMPLSP